jgi:hypothetical protein
MSSDREPLESLKNILENSFDPRRLDSHPWASSLIVQEAVADDPHAQEKTPGQRLVGAIGKLFIRMMPSTPLRHGKRLDTRWGEFGILAAQYFAPILLGKPFPNSLREAWGCIDQSILFFVYEKPEEALSKEEIENYKLVGDETEVAPNSTLSDWNRKGLQRLLELILTRERFLSESLSKPPAISWDDASDRNSSPVSNRPNQNALMRTRKSVKRQPGKGCIVFLLLGIILLGLLLVGAFKARQIFDQAVLVRQDAAQIQNLISSSGPYIGRIQAIGPPLSALKQDFATLKDEIEPFLWIAPWTKWIPVYGGDLASAQEVITILDSLLDSAYTSYQAFLPFHEKIGQSGLDPARLTEFLNQAQLQFIEAQGQLDRATTARNQLNVENFSPEVRNLVLNNVDPLIALMQDGLTIAHEFPLVMGATGEGPKTYLLLVQNEDELRPTGGFITAIGTLLVQDGKISNISFEDSSLSENWRMPYPAAPWQLHQYMNSPVLILGDSSWYTDYPTAALYAETLYSYTDSHSVDGVIAFDQQLLVQILAATGPLDLEGVAYPIDSGNVIAYMRSAKTPTEKDLATPDWNNKVFISRIANALIGKIFNGEIQPDRLVYTLLKALNEHHLLLKLDNPAMTFLLARHRWDGAVRPKSGDFLMVVDSNIGFNKTNAVVESSLGYEVNLTDLQSPTGSLTQIHRNNASATICKHWYKIRLPGENDYPITDCYWNYLRVYLPGGSALLEANPQFVPANWMILKQNVPAQVDTLDEGIDGVQAFGTLQVVPGGQSLMVNLSYSLPAGILQELPGTDHYLYHLLVQKQPGTLAVPFILRVVLPANATIEKIPSGAVVQGGSIIVQTNLQTDREFMIEFQTP